jgi:hypothetical protein
MARTRKPAPIRWQDCTAGANNVEQARWTCDGDHPQANGRTYTNIRCPFCSADTRAYLWSLAASGKRCSCGALHGRFGQSYRWAPGAA